MTDCSCEEKCKEPKKEFNMSVQGEYIVIERDKAEDSEQKSPGGIVLVARKPAPHTATVVGVGSKVSGIKAGDRIIIGKFVGTMFEHDDDELCAISPSDVIALV